METIKISFNEKMQIILICGLFGIKLIPQLQYTFTGITWSILYQALFFIWLLLTIGCSGVWIRFLIGYLRFWVLWLIYLSVSFLVFPNTQLGFFSLNLTFWEPLLVFYYYTQVNNNFKIGRYIAVFSLMCLFIGLIQSIQSINVNELAAREASSGHGGDDAILTGNYSFTAALTLLLPVGIIALIKPVKMQYKLVFGLYVLLSFSFILYCNLMISILCSLFSVILLLVFDWKKRTNPVRILGFLAISIVIIITFSYWMEYIYMILDSLATFISSSEIDKKVMQLKFLMAGSLVGNVGSRFGLISIALETFINNPVFGIGPQNNADIYFKTMLGLHATFFDDLARYGIIGMGIMLSVYRNLYCKVKAMLEGDRTLASYKCAFVIFFIISMLNPTISANVGIILFFVLPIISLELVRQSKRLEGK